MPAQQDHDRPASTILRPRLAEGQHIRVLAKPGTHHALEHRLPIRAEAFAVDDAHAHPALTGAMQEDSKHIVRLVAVESMQIQLCSDRPVAIAQLAKRAVRLAGTSVLMGLVDRLEPV